MRTAEAQVTAEDLLTLQTERIVELAKMGEPEAQYWVGKAIASGAIQLPGASLTSSVSWMIAAADQGHENAAFHFFENAYLYPAERRSVALRLLQPIAARGSGRAHYLLWYHADYRPDHSEHLLQAVELGYRPAVMRLGAILSLGSFGSFEWDLHRSISLLQTALSMPREPETSPQSYHTDFCLAQDRLRLIFSGQIVSSVEDRSIQDTSAMDPSAAIKVLQDGADYGCPLLTLQLAERYWDGEGVPQDTETAERLAQQVLASIEETDFLYPWVNLLLVETLTDLGRFEDAIRHVQNLKVHGGQNEFDRSFLTHGETDSLLGIYGPGAQICRAKDIPLEECKKYINAL